MRYVVTGVAGFIGSHTAEALLAQGDAVLGIDSINDRYDRANKADNLSALLGQDRFEFVEADLTNLDLRLVFRPDDVVIHLAAIAGVRDSWASDFGAYASSNVIATQCVLEAAARVGVTRVVYASSSSVYGNANVYPVTEDVLPAPHSPYGVTKLAAEHLCSLYAANHGVSTVSLRYFTVYGPRQRPDMAIHRLIAAGIEGSTFALFGDGSARRDFTYVGDVVRANIAATCADVRPGTVVNIAGGSDITMTELVEQTSAALGQPIRVSTEGMAIGDVKRTGASIDAAVAQLGWRPQVGISEGLDEQVAWHRARMAPTIDRSSMAL